MQRILLLLFLVSEFSVFSQIKTEIFVDQELFETANFRDSVDLHFHLRKTQISWIKKGYYFNGVDSILLDSTNKVYLHRGEQFDGEFDLIRNKNIVGHLEKELERYTDNGYPFASIKTDSLAWNQGKLIGNVRILPGPEIQYDSAYFFKEIKTNNSYVYHLLDIVPGDLFSEHEYTLIASKINRSTFLSLNRPPDLSFRNNRAEIFLDINESASNTFQGVL
ncbi:MAG: hypothetical protein AAFY41_05745, partial [Bacteroidota bacterium]